MTLRRRRKNLKPSSTDRMITAAPLPMPTLAAIEREAWEEGEGVRNEEDEMLGVDVVSEAVVGGEDISVRAGVCKIDVVRYMVLRSELPL